MHRKQLIIENITFNELADAIVHRVDEKLLKRSASASTAMCVLLTQKEAAEKLRVSTRTIHNWIKSGIIPCYEVGNRTLLKSTDIEHCLIRKEF